MAQRRKQPTNLHAQSYRSFTIEPDPNSLPLLVPVEDHSRRLLRRIYSRIGYRSKHSASLLLTDGANGELWYRWFSPTSPRLPQSRLWLRILEHLHWRIDHQYPFHHVSGLTDEGDFSCPFRVTLPELPDCRLNWGGHPAPGPLLFQWIAEDKAFSEYELPFRVSDKEDRPCDRYSPSRIEWLRIGECALWKIYGYNLQNIHSIDWRAREVEWKHGREPRSRQLRRASARQQLPVNPCDLLTDEIDFRM